MGVLKQLWASWKRVAEKIARVQTVILLTLLYVLLILPFAFVVSLFGDPLRIKRARSISLWHPRGTPPANLDAARKQF